MIHLPEELLNEFKTVHDRDMRRRTMVPSLQQLEDVMYKAEQISEEGYEDYGFIRGGNFTMTCLIYAYMLAESYRSTCRYGFTNDKTPHVKPRQRAYKHERSNT